MQQSGSSYRNEIFRNHKDENFKFNKHIININNKLRRVNYQLYNLRNVLPKHVKLILYHSLFESIIRYGITIWGSARSCYLNVLKRNQNRILKLIDTNLNNTPSKEI